MAVADPFPPLPYPGLNYYVRGDRLLFTGREDDVERGRDLLEASGVRLVLLHGMSGVGKSSFLRAGLIPRLENPESGFYFAKRLDTQKPSPDPEPRLLPLIVRSLAAPLKHLYGGLREFAAASVRATKRDLTPAFHGIEDPQSPVSLLEILKRMARILPRTLVVVIDQAEEVLTLQPGASGDPDREACFEFLKRFSLAEFDVKVMLSLRTEYLGRFLARLGRTGSDLSSARDFFLDELTSKQMHRAILRPTDRTPVSETIPSPYSKYEFEYDTRDKGKGKEQESLAERIVSDLTKERIAGGYLPALQLACAELYLRSAARVPRKITFDDYDTLGGIRGQLTAYVNRTLDDLIRKKFSNQVDIINERARWRTVLSNLVYTHPDGTVTTQLVEQESLREIAREAGVKLDFDMAINHLADPEVRLLRREGDNTGRRVLKLEAGKRRRRGARKYRDRLTEGASVSLGHDAIGLVLRDWRERQRGDMASWRKIQRQRRIIATSGAAFYWFCAGGFAGLWLRAHSDAASWIDPLRGLFGILALIMAIISFFMSIPLIAESKPKLLPGRWAASLLEFYLGMPVLRDTFTIEFLEEITEDNAEDYEKAYPQLYLLALRELNRRLRTGFGEN